MSTVLHPTSQLARSALCHPEMVKKFLLENEIEPDAIAALGTQHVELYGETVVRDLCAWVSRRRRPVVGMSNNLVATA